jgi:hypothetical protein
MIGTQEGLKRAKAQSRNLDLENAVSEIIPEWSKDEQSHV